MTTPRGADPLAQQLRHEIPGAGRGQFVVEMEHQRRIGAGFGEQFSRWSSVVRRNGGTCGAKWRTGCGSKVATIAGRALTPCPFDGLAHHCLVAEMEPVEIAERDDRAAQVVGGLTGDG